MTTTGQGPPKIDFSQAAVKKAVGTEVLTHPVTLYPLVIACLSGLVGLLFSSPIAYGILLSSGFIGLTGGIVNYCFRDEAIANRYIRRMTNEMLAQKESLLQKIRKDLENLSSTKEAKICAQAGLQQFDKIKEEYESVKKLLEEKFKKGELSYSRILGTAEQLYLSVLDNLTTLTEVLKSCAILHNYSNSKERLTVLLTQNDKAIDNMAETMAKLITLHTNEGFTDLDIETAIQNLSQIAQELPLYDKRQQKEEL